MEAYKLDKRIADSIEEGYPCPSVCLEFVRQKARDLVEAHKDDPAYDVATHWKAVDDTLKGTSFVDMAVPGTGLPPRITHSKVHGTLERAVLELVHLTEIGISALDLERIRQNRDRRSFLNLISTASTRESEEIKDATPPVHKLDQYPRRRLKLFLSDGFTELQAIELERLAQIELGETPMGTKIYLKNVEIVEGIAYLRKENVVVLGGEVIALQLAHRRRLYDEFDTRVQGDLMDSAKEEVSPQELYQAGGL